MGSERFLSSSEKRSIPMDDGAGGTTCSDGRISELFSELSESCQNYLFQATAEYEFEEESTIICESCGRPLYSLLECLNSGPTELELFDVLCTENENSDNSVVPQASRIRRFINKTESGYALRVINGVPTSCEFLGLVFLN